MNTILIATDLEPETENALFRALQLAHEHGVMLHILHITHVSSPPSNADKKIKIEENRKAKIQALIERQMNWKNVDYQIHIVFGGRILDQIDSFARQINADLVVMGADRSSASAPSFIRSKAENILWRSKRPVLAVFKDVTSSYENALIIGKQYTAGLLDLIDKTRHIKDAKKLIGRVEKTINHFKEIPDCSEYDYIRDTPSLDILSEIKSKKYDLAVLEVSFNDLGTPDAGEEIHSIIMDETCDVLPVEKS